MDSESEDQRESENSHSSVEICPNDTCSSGTWSPESEDISSVGTLLDSDDEGSVRTLLDSDDESTGTLLDSDYEEEEEEESFSCSQVCMSHDRVDHRVKSCFTVEETSETFATIVMEQAVCSPIHAIPYTHDERLIQSQPSIMSVPPFSGVLSCSSTEETPDTFASLAQKKEHFASVSEKWQQPQERLLESQASLPLPLSCYHVSKCLSIEESSEMFSLSVLWQEECAVMLNSAHHEEEKFLDSQFSITNRPFLGVSYCLQGVETPGTFGLAIKEQERFSFMLDSQLLIFDRLCLDS